MAFPAKTCSFRPEALRPSSPTVTPHWSDTPPTVTSLLRMPAGRRKRGAKSQKTIIETHNSSKTKNRQRANAICPGSETERVEETEKTEQIEQTVSNNVGGTSPPLKEDVNDPTPLLPEKANPSKRARAGAGGIPPTPNADPPMPLEQDIRGACFQPILDTHPYQEICMLSTETMVLVLQRLDEILTRIVNIEKQLDTSSSPLNAQGLKRMIRNDSVNNSPTQTMDEVRSCQVLQTNQIMLEIHQYTHRWMNRRQITMSLSQLLNYHYRNVDLENFHFLPTLRNTMRLFMTFRSSTLPYRLMEIKDTLWWFHSLRPVRVFKDETRRQLVPCIESKLMRIKETKLNTRNTNCPKEEKNSVSLELQDLKKRLMSIKTEISTQNIRTVEPRAQYLKTSNSSLSHRKTSVQLPVPFSNDTKLDEEFGASDISMATTHKELYVADNLEISSTKSTSGPLPNVPKTYQNDQPSLLYSWRDRMDRSSEFESGSLLASDPHFITHTSLILPQPQIEPTILQLTQEGEGD